jgi:hypothetical protein
MPELTVFAQMPATPEAIIVQVQRELARDDTTASATEVARLADRAVRRLWDSRVKVFIPVLALRDVREALGQQDHVVSVVPTSLAAASAPPLASQSPRPSPQRDVLPIPHDWLSLEQDVLPLDADWMPLEDDEPLSLE